MKIYFSHGKESGPWGSKIKRLAEIAENLGFVVDSIDYTDSLNADVRVEKLLSILETEEYFLLVGSSMGGYVSLVTAEKADAKGLFLLAPALFIENSEYAKQSYKATCHVEIVHGWSDDVIPPENSIKFAKEVDCQLHLISGDHRLNSSLAVVEKLFEGFLANYLV